MSRAPILFVAAMAAAPTGGRTEVTGGVGAGSYTTGFGCNGGVLRDPYQEASLAVKHETGNVSAGIAVGLRDDDAEEAEVVHADEEGATPPTIRSGTRWIVSPWVGYRWRFLHLRGGVHTGDYYSVQQGQDVQLILPRAAVGVGGDRWFIDAGLLDPPDGMPVFSSNGGLGLISFRGGLRPRAGHLLQVSFGGSSGDGFAAVSYLAQLGRGLLVGAGGFAGEYQQGAFVLLGVAVDR